MSIIQLLAGIANSIAHSMIQAVSDAVARSRPVPPAPAGDDPELENYGEITQEMAENFVRNMPND